MPSALELREKLPKLWSDAKAVLDQAKTENRAATPEEEKRFDDFMAEYDSTKAEVEKAEKVETRSRWLEQEQEHLERTGGRKTGTETPGRKPETRTVETETKLERRSTPEYHRAFQCYMEHGQHAFHLPETRAYQMDNDVSGGGVVAPQDFVERLFAIVKDLVWIRKLVPAINQFTLKSAHSLGFPVLDTEASDSDWTAELATGNEETTVAFSKREFVPHPLAKRLKVSSKLLRASAIDFESVMCSRLAYKVAVTEEKAFLTGSGAGVPLGIFTPSANGIDTGRDISEGSTSTALTADSLINALYNLKAQYQESSSLAWVFHRLVFKTLRRLKDGNGQYLLVPGYSTGVTQGSPDRLLNVPVSLSEFAPSTMTSGLYVGMLGDFRFYAIADALDMQIQRLIELYAETNQVGFIARKETDGMPILAEAWTRLKLG